RRCNGRPASPSISPWTLARAPLSSVFRGKPAGPRGFITRGAGAVPVGRLEGRVAIVTGGSGGLGRAVALDLAREGANLAVQYGRGKDTAQAVVEKVQGLGRKAAAIQSDMTDPGSCRTLAAKALATFGRIDVAACFAGHPFRADARNQEFSDFTPAQFSRPLHVDRLGSGYVAHDV